MLSNTLGLFLSLHHNQVWSLDSIIIWNLLRPYWYKVSDFFRKINWWLMYSFLKRLCNDLFSYLDLLTFSIIQDFYLQLLPSIKTSNNLLSFCYEPLFLYLLKVYDSNISLILHPIHSLMPNLNPNDNQIYLVCLINVYQFLICFTFLFLSFISIWVSCFSFYLYLSRIYHYLIFCFFQ